MLKDYIDLEYKPTKRDFVCEYHIEPVQGVGFEHACTHMAGESSIDKWSYIYTLSPQLVEELKPRFIFTDKKQQDAISIAEYTKTHTELKVALDKWG